MNEESGIHTGCMLLKASGALGWPLASWKMRAGLVEGGLAASSRGRSIAHLYRSDPGCVVGVSGHDEGERENKAGPRADGVDL